MHKHATSISLKIIFCMLLCSQIDATMNASQDDTAMSDAQDDTAMNSWRNETAMLCSSSYALNKYLQAHAETRQWRPRASFRAEPTQLDHIVRMAGRVDFNHKTSKPSVSIAEYYGLTEDFRKDEESRISRKNYKPKPCIKETSISFVDQEAPLGFGTFLDKEIIKYLSNIDYQHRLSITHINLSYQLLITELTLQLIGTYFPNLKSINLADCPGITDAGLYNLTNNCKNIEAINLSRCYKITDDGIGFLANSCRKLKFIQFYNCSNISGKGIHRLYACCQSIKISYYNNNYGSQNAISVFNETNNHSDAAGEEEPIPVAQITQITRNKSSEKPEDNEYNRLVREHPITPISAIHLR